MSMETESPLIPRSGPFRSGLRHIGGAVWGKLALPLPVLYLFFCVVVFVVCVEGLVKVIFTGDMCGGKELAMLCIILLILGLPLTGTVIVLVTGVTAFGTSFRRTGEELEEFVRRLLRGFSSSSEQLTPSLFPVSAGTGREALC